MEEEKEEKVRIYVGGLGESVTADELSRLFQLTGGVVDSVDFVRTKGRSLAYVDFLPSSPKSLSNLFAKYNGCAWKGGKLRLEKAKEHYLIRLNRDWSQEKQKQEEEEEAKAKAQAQAQAPPPPPSHIHRKQLDPDNTNLIRIYFPRLYKVKSLPFSGSGKHKYSFQRVDVPSLPKYFCDCEEHSSSLPENEKDKQVAQVESQSGGINEQELEIMNKVMNNLFQSQNQNHDQDEDEDNLIINVVTKDQPVPSFGRPQLLQEPRPKRGPFVDVSAIKKGNDKEPPFKKKKSVVNDKTSGKEFESPALENKEGVLGGSNKSVKHKSSASGSKKSSWKELLDDSKKSPFSISGNLFSMPVAEEVKPRSDTSCDSDNENDSMETDGELENTSCLMKTDELIGVEEEEVEASDKKDNLERNGELESRRAEELVVQEAQPADKMDNLERDGKMKDTSCEMKAKELVGLEAQPADEKVVSNQAGRGAFWRHKSSWTQLIGESTSFSISQVIPGVTSNQQITAKPNNPFVANFSNVKNNNVVNPAREDSPDVSKMGKKRDVSRSTEEEEQQTELGNNESSILMSEQKSVAAAKQTSPMKVEISNTCSFMRSATSLKEWAKTKAALSGSLKKQGPPK